MTMKSLEVLKAAIAAEAPVMTAAQAIEVLTEKAHALGYDSLSLEACEELRERYGSGEFDHRHRLAWRLFFTSMQALFAPACPICQRWAKRGFRCNKLNGECDCPKCQGLCTCHQTH
jgi:hypothetical protein